MAAAAPAQLGKLFGLPGLSRRLENRENNDGLTTTNPAREVETFRESSGKMRFLSETEADRLILAASEHLKPILVTALSMALRNASRKLGPHLWIVSTIFFK